jgi:RNA polymerase primary sigma factor
MSFSTRKGSAAEGSLDQYLKEISQYPLIDRDEEGRLARGIRSGDPECLDKLVRSNLRFVVSVAKKYQNQGVLLSDLINEGNLGLIRAAHKFDETKGIKFISYAVWWIRQAILQALAEQSRIVRVPLNRAGALHRIGKRSSSLLQELGREPTVEEIADGLDLSEEEVASTLAISQSHLSLDAPLSPGEDNRLLDYLPDQFAADPEDEAYEHALKETVDQALSTLKEREAKVLAPVLRPGRPGAHDPGGDRGAPGHHPGAGPADQGEGPHPPPPRLQVPLPGDLHRLRGRARPTLWCRPSRAVVPGRPEPLTSRRPTNTI